LVIYIAWALRVIRDYDEVSWNNAVLVHVDDMPEDLVSRAICIAGELIMKLVLNGLLVPEDDPSAHFGV
jgi:hypothetical protein